MDQNVKDYVIEKTNELIAAFSCSPETKEAAERWLAAVNTEGEAAETAKYIAELEGPTSCPSTSSSPSPAPRPAPKYSARKKPKK